MNHLEVLSHGTYQRWDPYNSFGVGLPDDVVELEDATDEQLVACIPNLLRHVRLLQEEVQDLNKQLLSAAKGSDD